MQAFFAVNGILLQNSRRDGLRLFGEICEDDCALARVSPHKAEDVFILSGDDFQLAACESLMLFSQFDQHFQPLKDSSFDGVDVVSFCVFFPICPRTMHPAAVSFVGGVVAVGVVVERANFIAKIDAGESRQRLR